MVAIDIGQADGGAATDGYVNSLMKPPAAIFTTEMTVSEAIALIRAIPDDNLFTYGYVLDDHDRLSGVLVMRRLLSASPDSRIADVMERDVYSLKSDMSFLDAMKSTMARHYPEYPVCDDERNLIGVVRGQTLFAAQVVTLTAQSGEMVGIVNEDGPDTPFWRSLKYRFPWLQANLLTAFLAAGVVGFFQDLIDRIVLLAIFLPVLAGQTGNTGAQSLSVTLRAMTLGRLNSKRARTLISKEARLGVLNGAAAGIVAGGAMFLIAMAQDNSAAARLGIVVFLAMTFGSVVSGLAGGMLPLILKRLGADPAVASSIILSTATDIVSMGSMLALATLIV